MDNLTLFGIFVSIFTVVISLLYKYFCSKYKLYCENKHSASKQKNSGWGAETNREVIVKDLKNEENKKSGDSDLDPVDFCSHIQREIKKTQRKTALKKIESTMTREQKEEERAIQRKQLEDIFKLMVDQKEFGVSTVDDIHEQMKLYA